MKLGILVYSHPEEAAFCQAANPEELKEAAQKRGHEAVVLYEPFFTFLEKNIFYAGEKLQPLDAIISRPNFIGNVNKHIKTTDGLQEKKYRVINGAGLIKEIQNKTSQYAILQKNKIPMPHWSVLDRAADVKEAIKNVGFPLVVKVPHGSLGIGVFYAENMQTLQPIVDYLEVKNEMPVVVEEFIAEAGCKDRRAFVLGGKVIGAYERIAAKGEFRCNTGPDRKRVPVKLTDEEKKIAIAATELFKLEIAGVDLILSDRGPLVLEVNANPGVAVQEVTGVDIPDAIIAYTETQITGSK